MTNGREVAVQFNRAQFDLMRETLAPGLDDNEFALFGEVVKQTGLNPFSHQIYAMKYGGRLSIITGIDGYRLLAQRSGQYEGETAAEWCGADGQWVDVWLKAEPPSAARIGVYRAGHREPTYAVALWTEYVRKGPGGQPQAMWASMPSLMLAKCAEALALRKAFPAETSGIYTDDEMDQANREQRTQAPARRQVSAPRPSTPTPAVLTNDGVREMLTAANVTLDDVAAYMGPPTTTKALTAKVIADAAKDIGATVERFIEKVAEHAANAKAPLDERMEEPEQAGLAV